MEELNLLKKLEGVKAPPDFEQNVLAQLSLRKKRKLRVNYLRFSLAGAFSGALVFFIIVNVFILPKKSSVEFTGLERDIPSSLRRIDQQERETIPIIEILDYFGDVKSLSREPRTIYILEQVSDKTSTKIKY